MRSIMQVQSHLQIRLTYPSGNWKMLLHTECAEVLLRKQWHPVLGRWLPAPRSYPIPARIRKSVPDLINGVPCPVFNRLCASEFGLRNHLRAHRRQLHNSTFSLALEKQSFFRSIPPIVHMIRKKSQSPSYNPLKIINWGKNSLLVCDLIEIKKNIIIFDNIIRNFRASYFTKAAMRC